MVVPAGDSWHVPDAWLLAFLTTPGEPPIPFQDQTRYSISGFRNGYYFGDYAGATDGARRIRHHDVALRS